MLQINDLLRRLNDGAVDYLLIGGVAVTAHGFTRMTLDLDVCAPLDHENAVRIIRALADVHPRWWMRPDLPEIDPNSPMLSGLKNMYLRTNIGRLDVLGDVPGVGGFTAREGRAVSRNIGGVACRVIDIDSLIAAKRFANRDRDKLDVRELEIIRERQRLGGRET